MQDREQKSCNGKANGSYNPNVRRPIAKVERIDLTSKIEKAQRRVDALRAFLRQMRAGIELN